MIAGALGSAGAITSLVSYPALLIAGVPAFAANVVNIVAVTALWPASALASRPELTSSGRWLKRHLPFAALGGGAGVALLLSTPSGSFRAIVPFLVVLGALALLFSPLLTTERLARQPLPFWALDASIVLVSIYSGYFGAGSGVMMLSVLLVAVNAHLPTANALKNMLIGAGSLLAASTLIVLRPVDWAAVAPLAVGLLFGGVLGPGLVRRVPPSVARPVVAALGLALAVQLWVAHGS